MAGLKQAITQTVLTASSDSTRPVLTGVYWHSYEGALYLASTDGYRLSEKRLVPTSSEVAAIIPTSSLQEVLRGINDDIAEVEVLFDETQVRFRLNDAEITSRLIDGNFPDYRQLIPATSESVITLPRSEFSQITKVAGLFARQSGGSVTWPTTMNGLRGLVTVSMVLVVHVVVVGKFLLPTVWRRCIQRLPLSGIQPRMVN